MLKRNFYEHSEQERQGEYEFKPFRKLSLIYNWWESKPFVVLVVLGEDVWLLLRLMLGDLNAQSIKAKADVHTLWCSSLTTSKILNSRKQNTTGSTNIDNWYLDLIN